MAPIPPPQTNAIEAELHQIRSHVESSKVRIHHLEQQLGPSATEQVARIKTELAKALHDLENMQQRGQRTLLVVSQVTKEARRAFQNLKNLESRSCSSQHDESTTFAEPNGEEHEGLLNFTEETWFQSSATIKEDGHGYMMTGAVPAPRSAASRWYKGVEVRLPTRGEQMNGCHMVEDTGHEADIEEAREQPGLDGSYTYFPLSPRRSRPDVLRSLVKEEFAVPLTRMHEPDRIRQGSTSGWQCAQEIMNGVKNSWSIRPKLSFFKVYEVKALKQWLVDNRYLQRSAGISRTEKLLHLIFALQDGTRFENLAVLFSRSPRQVQMSCAEAFNGILEMHSETMLPSADESPLYDHLWKIVDRYSTISSSNEAEEYYPWDGEDLYKVLVTLNFYIGRWRKQGRFALDGPSLPWGTYMQTAEE